MAKMTYKKLHTVTDTVNEMKRLVDTYYHDMDDFASYSSEEFFDWLKNFPYRRDPMGIEYVMRPSLIIKRGSCDCDEKTILALSWGKLRGLKGGMSIVSQRMLKPWHHVFPYFLDKDGKRIDFDGTYAHNKLGAVKPYMKRIDIGVL